MRHSPGDTRPERRALRIYAFDPMLGRGGDYRATIEVPYRDITHEERSFHDDRLEVVDYDASAGQYYRALDLNDSQVAMQQGLEPSEADPQFHQQMVYAVASRVLENFDRALGRRLRFWGGQRLRLMPHAFQGRNAYYDNNLVAVLFGYFPADEDDPGPNLPGQFVFTCLSHDIIAHEVTHAALDRLHRHYREPSNPQVPALHEAFADLVAIFQRFTFPEVVRAVVRQTKGNLLQANPLLEVGAQFGAASGLGSALRTLGGAADPAAFARTRKAHALGRFLVEAVYEGFAKSYERKIADLIRIATEGSGRLREGDLHPDLVNRLSSEAARMAQTVLTMCIRATDYMPPVDPTFSDFLRAMVTADFEVNRADEVGLRAAMIEAFRVRGIRPEAVGSLAVESLLLAPADPEQEPDKELGQIVRDLLELGAQDISLAPDVRPSARAKAAPKRKQAVRVGSQADWIQQQHMELASYPSDEASAGSEEEEPESEWSDIARRLWNWARAENNVRRLGLDAGLPIAVRGYHPVHRLAPTGELLIEMVAKFVQSRRPSEDLGGLSDTAGLTMVATSDGRIRYLIAKPFHEARSQARREWVAAFDAEAGPSWPTGARSQQRMLEAFSARAMDGRRWA